MKSIIPLVVLSALSALSIGLASETRTFTSVNGDTIEAEVLAVNGDEVVIKRGTRSYTVPVDRFSPADREYFAEWQKKKMRELVPRLEVHVNSGKSDRSDRSDSFDDRIGSFEFSVRIENEEPNYVLKEGEAALLVFGESCEVDDRYCIMQKNSFPVSLEDGGELEWEGDERLYRFDNRPPAYWGFEYYGYLLQIKNASGKVIYQKVTPTKFEDGVDKLIEMRANEAFDDRYRKKGRASIYDR